MKSVCLISGGLDSAVALSWAKSRPDFEQLQALSFWYGSKHNDQEWKSAQKITSHYHVPILRVRLDFVAEYFKSDLLTTGKAVPHGHYEDPSMRHTVVPFRNGIMLSIAAGYAESVGAQTLIIANHFGDHAIYPDCRKTFIEPMAKAIREGTYANIECLSPFVDMNKTEIVRLGHQLKVPFEMTWSCYEGGDQHCGRCGTCYERREAFERSGIKDPTKYMETT